MTFEIVKRNYKRGLWGKKMVEMCIKKGVITEEQYKEIVGEK